MPGLPGVFFRDMRLTLGKLEVGIYGASAVDVQDGSPGPNEPLETYWSVAWPAGLALARELAGRNLAGARVLELGCGVGVAAVGAAIGGADVLATDCEPGALRLARMNARRNGLRLRLAAADWRAWPVAGRWKLVVGSDITYQPEAFPALLDVLEAAVEAGGEALLTDPGRLAMAGFEDQAQRRGWRIECKPLGRDGTQPVFAYRLTRRGSQAPSAALKD